MSMREFLRGGYRDLHDMTVVANHGRPVFVVTPVGLGQQIATPKGGVTFIPPAYIDDAPSTGDESVLRSGSGDGPSAPPRSAGVSEA
jgi:hypothetical protein